jgi:electron transport complex protein RnfC
VEKTGYIDYRNTPKQKLLDKIHDCGIAGMGGAGFPTRIKLDPRNPDSIHTLIVNGAECEPYITADDRLMREMTDELVIGISVLAHLLGHPANCIIAVEDNKPEAIAALRTAATGKKIEIVVLPTKYPTGSEKQLIQIITGKQVPPGKLPSDLGVVVQNITTTVAVFRAVILGKPLSRRITTVTGEAVARPGNYKVLVGTPVSHLLKHAGFDPSLASRLIMGGPMMGFTIADPRVPIVKTSNCVLAPSIQELPPPPPAQPCINCGLCMQACPMQLLPQQLYWHCRGHNPSQLEKLKLMDCIECGSCSYTCTSNIPLVHYFRAAKGEIRAAQQAQLANQHAKQRQQARVDRKAAILAEKEAKRLARKNPGNPPVTADTPGSDQPADSP